MSRPQRPPRRRAKALALLALATSIAISGVVVLLVAGLWSSPQHPGAVGFDWPNAGRVYVAQLTQQSTTPAMPARPFTVAASHGITRVRVFVGDDLVIRAWQRDPVTTFARIQQLLDDAAAAHVKIIFSNYLTQETVAALAGHPYSSWAAAQQDLTTPGSAPWNELSAWLQSVAGRFGSNHTAASFEVMNEPNYMLGLDSQAVERDQGLRFLDHFAELLHRFGAAQVNGGGRPVFDPMTLTDAQLALYVRHLDVLDDHLYPALAADGTPTGTATDARAAVAGAARWFTRARRVNGDSRMPAMLGEVGSAPDGWGRAAVAAGSGHGFTTLVWGFDAYDANNFTDTVRPVVLAWLSALSARGAAALT